VLISLPGATFYIGADFVARATFFLPVQVKVKQLLGFFPVSTVTDYLSLALSRLPFFGLIF